jgi:hypothetical protein
MAADIEVKDDSAFVHANSQMNGVTRAFQEGMQRVAQDSASPAAAGTMDEGKTFMRDERSARELLAQYMTKTSQGLTGYESTMMALDREHDGLVSANITRLKALLRPTDGAVRTDGIFDWRNAVAHQIANPNGGN